MKTTRKWAVSLLAILAIALVMPAGASAQDAAQVRFTNNTGVTAYDLYGVVTWTGGLLSAAVNDDPMGPPFPQNIATGGNDFKFVWLEPGIQHTQSVQVVLSVPAPMGPIALDHAYWTDAAGNPIGDLEPDDIEWLSLLPGELCDIFYTEPDYIDTSAIHPPPPVELPPYAEPPYDSDWGWPSPPWNRAGNCDEPAFPEIMVIPPGHMIVIGHDNEFVCYWIKWVRLRIEYWGPQIVVVGPYIGYPPAGGPPGEIVCIETDVEQEDGSRLYRLDCWIYPQPSWEYFKILNDAFEDVEIYSIECEITCGPTTVEEASWGSIKAMFR